jgi:hypothetical protein
MKKPASPTVPLAAAVMAAACVAAAPALAAEGLRVSRDAETGQLRAPTAEENAALDAAAAAQRAASGKSSSRAPVPVQKVHANGAVELQLGEDSVMYSVARINAQGKLERVCVQGDEARDKALAAVPSFASAPKMVQASQAMVRVQKGVLDEK